MGDLNPESLIRERLDESTGSPLRDRIGLWINSPAAQKAKSRSVQRGQVTAEEYAANSPTQRAIDGQTIASVLHQRFIAGMQACEQLPLATCQSLSAIYFSKVNHIIPIVDQEFCPAQSEGSASVFLEKAICLAAAKTRAASPHLRLVSDGPILPSRQFCSEIYKGLVVAMNAELEPDRLTRIRVLALMSLHCEGLEGAEAASSHLCQAIHQAQTVGLHLGRPNQTSTDSLTKLFWCLWTLDKMHASIGGRPVLLADRDIGIVKPNVSAQTSRGAFEVWLAVSDLLATVISFYRPSAETTSGWEEGFPAFEDIVGEDTQGDLDFATLGMSIMEISAVLLKPRTNREQDSWNSITILLLFCPVGINPPRTLIAPGSHRSDKDWQLFEFTPSSHRSVQMSYHLFQSCHTLSPCRWVFRTGNSARVDLLHTLTERELVSRRAVLS